jgi:O-antigen/teichoic acid export membrane protein
VACGYDQPMTRPKPPEQDVPAAPSADGELGFGTPSPSAIEARRLEIGGPLRARAARGTLINTGFLVGLSLLGLVKGLVIAGFLSRSDYGLWGVLAVSMGTLVWLKQVGIGDKYIQQDEEDQEVAFQKAFTFELIFTGLLVVLLAAALPLLAVIYQAPQMVAPGMVVLLAIVAGAFQAPLWVFHRRMQFGRQRLLEAVDPVVGFVVSIAAAVAGAGYWALVIGLVAGACASAVVSVLYSPFRLRLRYEGRALRSYARFSWPLLVASGATVAMSQGAIIATQADLGLAATGVIALAANISSFTERVDQLVTGTLYPAICAVKDKTALLYESFVKSNRLALMWAVPFGTALTLFCTDLVHFGIGERWRPAITVLQVYGLTAAVGHIGFNWDAYFRARAETRPMAVANVAAMLAFFATGIPLLLIYGLRGFALGVAIQTLVHLVARGYYLQRLFEGFDFLRHAARGFMPTAPAVAVVLLLRTVEPAHRTLGIALGELLVYILITVAATWYFESRLLREALGYVFTKRNEALSP